MKKLHLLAAASIAAASLSTSALAHEHINAGATSLSAGSLLIFDNANSYVMSSGYVFNLTLRGPTDYYGGYFANNDLTFSALAATVFYGGPEAFHAAVGTSLSLQIVSVSGPGGGSFGFWEATDRGAATPTVSLLSGSVESAPGAGLFTFNLTQAYPTDPFGHVHNRAFSANMPGTYDVAFRIIDTTGYHQASDLYTFRFDAVPEPTVVAMLALLAGAGLVIFLRRRRTT